MEQARNYARWGVTAKGMERMENMKNARLLLLVYIALVAFSGVCHAANPDYVRLGMNLTEETMHAMFGGQEVADIVTTLGQPLRKVDKNESDYARWYFKRGVEIDVVNQSGCDMLFNYVYISSSSDLRTNRRIKVGSTKQEVIKRYRKEINSALNDDRFIYAGTKDTGLIFKMNNSKVNAIFIALGRGTMDNGGFPNR